MDIEQFVEFVKQLDGIEGYVISLDGLPYEVWGKFEKSEEEELCANISSLLRELHNLNVTEGLLKANDKAYFLTKSKEFDLAVFGTWEVIREIASLVTEPFICPNCNSNLTFEIYRCPKCGSSLPFTISYCPFCKEELVYKKCPYCSKKVSVSGREKPPMWKKIFKVRI